MNKDTWCLLLAGGLLLVCLYLMNQQMRRQEMFELVHLLSNGNILWYPSPQSPVYSQYQVNQVSPSIGNVQPLYVNCGQSQNQQLCQYLRTHQAPGPQLPYAHAYSDYAYGRKFSGAPQGPTNQYPPFNPTW